MCFVLYIRAAQLDRTSSSTHQQSFVGIVHTSTAIGSAVRKYGWYALLRLHLVDTRNEQYRADRSA